MAYYTESDKQKTAFIGSEKSVPAKYNRAFQEMFRAAQKMLEGRDPSDIAAKSDVHFDGASFLIPSMGKSFSFSYPDYVCTDSLQDWHYLTILHYLNLADGFPVTGESMSLSELPAGLVRGTKYDRTLTQELADFLKGKTEEQVKRILLNLGGEPYTGKGDLCMKLPFLPRFPLYLNIWFEDEEFPPSARLLIDRCAEHYLTIEDVVSLGAVVIELLNGA